MTTIGKNIANGMKRLDTHLKAFTNVHPDHFRAFGLTHEELDKPLKEADLARAAIAELMKRLHSLLKRNIAEDRRNRVSPMKRLHNLLKEGGLEFEFELGLTFADEAIT